MEGGDPDAHTLKRPRLDSVNAAYNGLPPPPPPLAQPAQRSSHPTAIQASSPPPGRHYPPHTLPPHSQPYQHPGPGHFGPPQPSPSLPPSDIRHLSDPRNIPSPGHRAHGLPNTPVTHTAGRTIPQDNIATYHLPSHPPPQSASAPDLQSSRSASASIDAKPSPRVMEHGASSWSDSRGGSISNGYTAAISPPNPNDPPYHTPPLPPAQHYGQPPPVGGYAPGLYMNQYAPGPGQMKRKQVRATQACNHCRARKQKCDEARPCQFCRENNFDCQYKDVPPPKQDRSMMQLQDSVNSISDTLQSFVETFNVWKQSVEGRLPPLRGAENVPMVSGHPSPEQAYLNRNSITEQHISRMPTPVQARAHYSRANSMKTESPAVPISHASPIPAQTPGSVKQEIMGAPRPPATPADSVDHPQQNGDSSKDRAGLQSDHTTPAHMLLLQWKQMDTFWNEIPELRKIVDAGKPVTDYPMQFEQDRGLLRVWGVGEGHDSHDGAQGPSSPESGIDSDAPSPASTKEGIWGWPPVDYSSPSTMSSETPRYFGHHGGLGPDGKPDFRGSTLQMLLESYVKHIHCLHPFLNPSKLRKMITEFGAVYSPEVRMANTMSPVGVSERLNPGVKRKRSNSLLGDGYGLSEDLCKGTIERSLRNAIVLLVLALGKACLHKDPLPSPQADRNPTTNGAWGYTRDSPHSANTSFSSSDSDSRPRNIDILPGMAYFSYATDILGNQQGGNTVAHAQAMILAALYLSQYARVLESWSWVNNACRVCLILIKQDFHKISRESCMPKPDGTEPLREEPSTKEKYRLNLVKCVYWTCLQLETDILAEMSTLPTSAVSKHQDEIMYPLGVYENFSETSQSTTEETENDAAMWIYSSLIHLRVILNRAHNALYGAGGHGTPLGFDGNNANEVFNEATSLQHMLKLWRNVLPPQLAWDDQDPPATDINVARLRAKFYGALYMILRPFLHIAVHRLDLPPAMSSHTSSPATLADHSTTPTNTSRYNRNLMDLSEDQAKYLGIAHECIKYAIQSTIAFDRVGAEPNSAYNGYISQRKERLILTNIFGTLHAQFGNMIVLAAVYKSQLRKFLPNKSPLNKANLAALFHRTIHIIREVAPNSPVLRIDLQILENVKRELQLDSH